MRIIQNFLNISIYDTLTQTILYILTDLNTGFPDVQLN